jgi:16S rRNA G966 N2-methylase RsmD
VKLYSVIRQIGIVHILEKVTVVLNFAAESAKWYDNDEHAIVIELDDAMSQHLAAAASVPLKARHRFHVVFLDPIELLGR